MLMPGTFLQSRYRILRQIGGGGMGVVYLAQDEHLTGLTWAIKEMSPNQQAPADRAWAIAAFQQEARLLANLQHPGLVHVTDYFSEYGNWYLVMDFVSGRTLEAWLTQLPNGFTIPIALNYINQLCAVLEYLHSQTPPVIFRDLKPGNVIVADNGEIKLIDFGIARFFKPGQTHNTIDLGTPGYASPEHDSRGQTDPRSDIYSLGVLFHQLVTGYDPVSASVPFQLPPVRSLNPQAPDSAVAAIQRATQLRPEQRYQSVAEFRQALFAPIPAMPASGRLPPQLPPQRASRPTAKWGPIGVAVVIGLMLIGAVAFTALPQSQSTPTAAPSTLGPGLTRSPSTVPPSAAPPSARPPSVAPPSPSIPTDLPPDPNAPRRIVFARGEVGCSFIVALDLDTRAETIYRGQDNTIEPTWSPDGSQFVASSGSCANGDQALFVFTLVNGRSVPIVQSGNMIDPDWGRDDRIYFVRGTTQTGGRIYSVRPDGSDERATGLSGRQPMLSADGRYLAYMRQAGSVWRVYVAAARGDGTFANPEQLSFPSSVAGSVHARMPHWLGDSNRVLFNVTDKNFNTIALDTVDLDTRHSTAWDGVSPNGQHFARPACGLNQWCVANEVNGGMWLLREDSGNFTVERQLTANIQDWGADIYP